MRYIDLVAIGTITDIVPLLDENRAIAQLGIDKMRRNPSAGVDALACAAGIDIAAITSLGVSFGLGPRINAAGRMDTAETAIGILSATQKDAALKRSAEALCALNDVRKQDVDDIITGAEAEIAAHMYMKDAAILIADAAWNPGVAGIAAAKIAERYMRPCILFGGNGDGLIGSARSIPGINIYDTLSAFAERFEKFGGHAQAAGLTIAPDVLDELRRDVCAYIDAHYDETVFEKKHEYDLTLTPGDITHELVKDLERLAPFGACNELPRIAVFGADITAAKFVGKDGQPHLKFVMQKDGAGIDAISFYFKASHSFVSRRCDFLCEASINDYSGRPQVVVRDAAIYFDKRLLSGYIKANRMQMARQFLGEACGLDSSHTTNADAFLRTLDEEMNKSRHGLCIVAGSHPALMRVLRLAAVRAALEAGTLSLYDTRAFSTANCLACTPVPGHERILRTGAVEETALFDDEMRSMYRQHAALYYADRRMLLGFYRTLSAFACSTPREMRDIPDALGTTPERAAFALQVLCELQLIEYTESGRILAIKSSGSKRDLCESICFRTIESLWR
jgi:hypothetical protein